MSLIVKAASAALIACVCMVLIKKRAPEHALLLAALTAVMLIAAALLSGREIARLWSQLAGSAAISGAVVSPVFKCVALGLITRLSADLCKDSGSAAIASAVELVGCVCALMAVSPLMVMLVDMIGG